MYFNGTSMKSFEAEYIHLQIDFLTKWYIVVPERRSILTGLEIVRKWGGGWLT